MATKTDPPWTPFERAHIPEEERATHPAQQRAEEIDEVWLNAIYQVTLTRMETPGFGCGEIIELSIKRRDRAPLHDWRDLQAIKNALVGPECEAVELYPAESRLVDTSNQYYLWVIPDPGVRFPFGFGSRMVVEKRLAFASKAVQRPFAAHVRPADLEAQEKAAEEASLQLTWKQRLARDRSE